MTKMTKKILFIASLIALIMTAFIMIFMDHHQKLEKEADQPKEVVKIGVILPLTGNSVVYGESFKNMFQMRFDEISKNSHFKYKIIFEDDQFDIKKQILAAQKLINIDDVDVIFTSSAGGEGAIADLMRGKNKLLFSSLWDVELPKNNDFFFNYTPTPEKHANVLAQELQKRNLKNVSIITINHRGAFLSIDEFKKIAPTYDIQILDEQVINTDMVDFGLLVSKMAVKNPDAYIALLIPPVLERWKVALDRQNIKTPITSMNTMDFTADKNLFEGHWYVSDSFIDQELFQKYHQKFGKELLMNQGYYGYLGLDLLIDAYEKYKAKPTAKMLAHDLLNMKKEDKVVGSISWSPDRLLSVTPIVKKVQNGQVVQVK